MEKEMLKTESMQYKDTHSINSSLQIFDIPTLIEKMKHELIWLEGELNSKVLLKSHHKQIVLTALHKGTEIDSYQSNNSITFQIIEGKIKFHTNRISVTLNRGELITLRDKTKYHITTKEETVLLLTITNFKLLPGEN